MNEYMNNVSVADAEKAGRDTLCWDCKKAMNAGCSWTDPEICEPVQGWEAKRTPNGYVVANCPEFVRDTYCRGRYRNADDYILALEIAVMQRNRQIAKIKAMPGYFRKKNAQLTKENEKLKETVKEMKTQIKDLLAVIEEYQEGRNQ